MHCNLRLPETRQSFPTYLKVFVIVVLTSIFPSWFYILLFILFYLSSCIRNTDQTFRCVIFIERSLTFRHNKQSTVCVFSFQCGVDHTGHSYMGHRQYRPQTATDDGHIGHMQCTHKVQKSLWPAQWLLPLYKLITILQCEAKASDLKTLPETKQQRPRKRQTTYIQHQLWKVWN